MFRYVRTLWRAAQWQSTLVLGSAIYQCGIKGRVGTVTLVYDIFNTIYICVYKVPLREVAREWRKNETKSNHRDTNTTTPEIEE